MTNAAAQPGVPSAGTPPGRESFGTRSVRGIAWLTLQTLGSKVVSLGGQIILAWLLSPGDFGLIGLAYTVSSLVGMLNHFGIEQVLVHRHNRFERWATAAFWLSLCLGVVSALVMGSLAPLAARIYGEPRLTGLLLVLAISTLLGNLAIVPRARVQSQLRFRFMAATGFVQASAIMALTVFFAWRGFGAYSFVLPMPLMAAGMAAWYWWQAPVTVHWRFQWRRWRFLLGDSVMLFVAGLLYTAISQGDYFVLGLLFASDIVGVYYFSFNLSMQAVTLFTVNLSNVLFPVLSKIKDNPKRQAEAFMRAIKALGVVGMPICLLQAALAEPMVNLLFDVRWQPSIPVIQLLSVAMALRVVSWPVGSMLMAQGRFQARLHLAWISTVIFFPLVLAGAWWHAAVGAAAGVTIFFAIIVPLNLYVALRPGNVSWSRVLLLFLPTFITAIVSILIAYSMFTWLHPTAWQGVLHMIAVSTSGIAIYVLAIRKVTPDATSDIFCRLSNLVSSYRSRSNLG